MSDSADSTVSITTALLDDICADQGDSDRDGVGTPLVAMGTLLVIGASFVSCFGVNLQKLAHNKNLSLPIEERKSMYRMWQWWLGIVAMIMGSVMDMAALPFVPMSRVAALGASTMVANIMITPIFLKETLTSHDLIGCLLAVAGTTIACVFGAGEEHTVTSECLLTYFTAFLFFVYGGVVIVALMALYYFIIGFRRMEKALVRAGAIEDKLECVWLHENLECLDGIPRDKYFVFVTFFGPQFYPCVHAIYAGTIGAQSVMFAKAVLKFLGNAVYGTEGEGAGSSVAYTLLFLVPTVLCLWNQIHYLNASLILYRDALFVLPVYQALWVSMGILSGLFFYQEYREIQHVDAILFAVGCLVSMVGLVVLARRESKTAMIPQSPSKLTISPALLSPRSADNDQELGNLHADVEEAEREISSSVHRSAKYASMEDYDQYPNASPIMSLPPTTYPNKGLKLLGHSSVQASA
ncbi:putative magnesium transporter NIPA8 [Diplonema papillatum]|nr:putative magnesium transporter NIPA8 [Diplonema papillatum]